MPTTPVSRHTVLGERPERTPWTFTLTLEKPDGAGDTEPITLAELVSLRLWLYDVDTDGIINSISNVDIKDTGRGTFGDTDGRLTVTLHSADNAIVTATKAKERHRALIIATYTALTGETETVPIEVAFTVQNLHRVP
jgi:hypothetical protein